MTFPWEANADRTVFVVTCNFKDLAIFKPKAWRGIDFIHVDVVWYSIVDTKQGDRMGMIRVGGNYNRLYARIDSGKFKYEKI